MKKMTLKKEQQSLSSFIWKVADDLWGDFKHTDFSRIILPLLLLRRLECVLEPSREAVRKTFLKYEKSEMDLELVLPDVSGYPFFNTSQYSLDSLGSTNTQLNLEDYVGQFSETVRKIFEEFKFTQTIADLHKANLLFRIVGHFAEMDLHPNVVTDRDMSNTYEELIRTFAASINEKAGEFMTPKDVVRLTTKLVLAPDESVFTKAGVIRTIHDPACGQCGFITDGIDQIHEFNPLAKIVPYGQELDPQTHAMALTSMLIRGYDADKIKQGNTLSDDQLRGQRFHYGLANPPFGIKWEKAKKAVVDEHTNLAYAGRFGPGLPSISDGSMLFLMHLVSKMEEPKKGGGRAGIVLSGSPLFNGDAGSGPSEIRRWLMEQDFVEAIIALPTDIFFNTGIGTYVWVLSNKKQKARKNQVQLIDATGIWSAMRKSEGTKRRHISETQIDDILHRYDAFEENKQCKIFKTTDFAYRKVTIQRPLRARLVVTPEKVAALDELKAFQKLNEDAQKLWRGFFLKNEGELDYHWITKQVKAKTSKLGKVGAPLVKAFTNHFIVRDPELEPVTDGKGNDLLDPKLKDTENVPFHQSVNDYFQREVLPHVPDALIDETVRDEKDGQIGIIGYEINFNRYFYEYIPPRDLADINADLKASEARIAALLAEVTA